MEASPRASGFCPLCKFDVIAKCGSVREWHWAHKSRKECDTWAENETEWHSNWKVRLIQKQFCECVIKPHRADIVGNDGIIIELQHSPISPEVIKERELFYKNMIWLVDITAGQYHLQIRDDGFFVWRNRSFKFAKSKVFMDCGNFIFEIEKFVDWKDVRGYGKKIPKGLFVQRYLSKVTYPLEFNKAVLDASNEIYEKWHNPRASLKKDPNEGLKKCLLCNFKSYHQGAVEHHMKYKDHSKA